MKAPCPLCLPVFGVAISILAGCSSTTVNTVEPASPVAQRHMISDQRILTDQSLSKSVRVVGINTAAGEEGFLKIQVEVENTTRQMRSFTYRIEWFDENGILIQLPTTTATPRNLEGRERQMITATAPTALAKDFRIRFLEPVTK